MDTCRLKFNRSPSRRSEQLHHHKKIVLTENNVLILFTTLLSIAIAIKIDFYCLYNNLLHRSEKGFWAPPVYLLFCKLELKEKELDITEIHWNSLLKGFQMQILGKKSNNKFWTFTVTAQSLVRFRLSCSESKMFVIVKMCFQVC